MVLPAVLGKVVEAVQLNLRDMAEADSTEVYGTEALILGPFS